MDEVVLVHLDDPKPPGGVRMEERPNERRFPGAARTPQEDIVRRRAGEELPGVLLHHPFLFLDAEQILEVEVLDLPIGSRYPEKERFRQFAATHSPQSIRGTGRGSSVSREESTRFNCAVNSGSGSMSSPYRVLPLRRLGGRGSVRGSPCDEPARLRFTSLRPPSCGDSAGPPVVPPVFPTAGVPRERISSGSGAYAFRTVLPIRYRIYEL